MSDSETPQGPSGPQELESWLGLCTDDSWTDTAIISLAGAATSIIFVAKKTFVATSLLLSGQTRVRCDQTGLLSRQKCFIDKSFVAASILLPRQKHVFCRDKTFAKTFVATRMILVAALANGTITLTPH